MNRLVSIHLRHATVCDNQTRMMFAAEVNEQVENIGARRLQTVMEKLLEDVSFDAENRSGETLVIDAAYVDGQLASISRDTDLSKYIL